MPLSSKCPYFLTCIYANTYYKNYSFYTFIFSDLKAQHLDDFQYIYMCVFVCVCVCVAPRNYIYVIANVILENIDLTEDLQQMIDMMLTFLSLDL